MKKRSLWMLLLAIAGFAGAFTSCKSDEGTNKINTLDVMPSATIQFKASGNEPVVLTVKTDAETWNFSVPEWIEGKKEMATLTLSAKDNTTDGSRSGRIEITAGTAQSVTISVTQSKRAPEDPDALSVDPSDDITFQAAGGEPVVLTVKTNVEAWECKAPEWVTVSKEGDKLTLGAQPNTTTDPRSGRIEVMAGKAQPVYINVLQNGADYPQVRNRIFISDFIDFAIYVDAKEEYLIKWYVDRFLKLRESTFDDPQSYFHRYAHMPEKEAVELAKIIWQSVNHPNLVENILPCRNRAHLILQKGPQHSIEHIYLRK